MRQTIFCSHLSKSKCNTWRAKEGGSFLNWIGATKESEGLAKTVHLDWCLSMQGWYLLSTCLLAAIVDIQSNFTGN